MKPLSSIPPDWFSDFLCVAVGKSAGIQLVSGPFCGLRHASSHSSFSCIILRPFLSNHLLPLKNVLIATWLQNSVFLIRQALNAFKTISLSETARPQCGRMESFDP